MSAPDPRFQLANERTFLAWVRTALGLIAGAAALVAVEPPWPDAAVRLLAVLLVLTGLASIVIAWLRWRRVDRAIADGTDARVGGSHLVPAAGVAIVAVGVLLLIVVTDGP